MAKLNLEQWKTLVRSKCKNPKLRFSTGKGYGERGDWDATVGPDMQADIVGVFSPDNEYYMASSDPSGKGEVTGTAVSPAKGKGRDMAKLSKRVPGVRPSGRPGEGNNGPSKEVKPIGPDLANYKKQNYGLGRKQLELALQHKQHSGMCNLSNPVCKAYIDKCAYLDRATDRRPRLHAALDYIMTRSSPPKIRKTLSILNPKDLEKMTGVSAPIGKGKPYTGFAKDADTEAFTIRMGEWRLKLDGKVLPTTWNSKGAAEAAIPVERARAAKKAKDDVMPVGDAKLFATGEKVVPTDGKHSGKAKDDYVRPKQLRIEGVKFIFTEDGWGVDPSDQDGYGDVPKGWTFKRSEVNNILADMGISRSTVDAAYKKWVAYHMPKRAKDSKAPVALEFKVNAGGEGSARKAFASVKAEVKRLCPGVMIDFPQGSGGRIGLYPVPAEVAGKVKSLVEGARIHTSGAQRGWAKDYDRDAVNAEIRKDKRIGGKEASLIHRLLQGRVANVAPPAKLIPSSKRPASDDFGSKVDIAGVKRNSLDSDLQPV